MCAIAGILNLAAPEQAIAAMQDTMKQRGPDDQGVWKGQECSLLHARLAVIDPERGKQPMVLQRGTETYVLVYNGELYNTAELRRELEKLGHVFLTSSDTEVVLYAYAQWGAESILHFNGIFAFAVWEEHSKRLFMARDRIGVKPLFYKIHENGFLFASEIKTILRYPGVRAELDEIGAAQLMLLGPGRMPGSAVIHGIEEVRPGHCGYFAQGRWNSWCYWKLRDRIHNHSFDETVETIRYLVRDSITRQMVSDVPIGTFLSGGLDSSLICAICARTADRPLPAFSLDYVDNAKFFKANKFQPNADPHYISIMADTLKADHHWTVLSPEELVAELENATEARDLPGMADVDFSLLAFCRQIRKKVKVALSGECADEIFGGYPWYRDAQVREGEGFPWARNLQQRLQLCSESLREKLPNGDFAMDAYRQTCRESDILPENTPLEKRMKEMVNLNFTWFMQTLLDRKDRMSMATSLEVRVPFCDYRIAEYMYAVPWEWKDYRGVEKGLLRKAMEGVLPDEILWRKKSPYPKTYHPQYTSMIRRRAEALMEDSNARIFAIVDRKAFGDLLAQEFTSPWYGQLMGGPQTYAYFLQMEHWLRHYDVSLTW